MVPYRVVKRWTEKYYDHTCEQNGRHWWDRNVEYRVEVYKIIEYELREYYNPNNGHTYAEIVETDSWYEERKYPTNDWN